MERIDAVKRKISSAEDLLSIVKSMKVLAAVSIRQYEEAADSIQNYFETIESGLQILLRDQPLLPLSLTRLKKDGKSAVIVFGSGQPMCGQFNESLASYLADRFDRFLEATPDKIVAIGERMAASLDNLKIAVDARYPVPVSVSAINERVQELVLEIERWYTEEEYRSVVLFNNRPVTESSFVSVRHQLLPIDRSWLERLEKREWPTKVLPTYSMDSQVLLSELIRHYYFVTLYKSYAESLSSEFGSRLAAMQMAEKRIDDRLVKLNAQFRERRQAGITEEILDIISGFEAIEGEKQKLQ